MKKRRGGVFVVIRVLGFCVKLVYKLGTSVACYRRGGAAAAAEMKSLELLGKCEICVPKKYYCSST